MPLALSDGRIYTDEDRQVHLDEVTNELCFWAETPEGQGILIRVA
jgi:hypothetical protein